jgi:hypothetical protein
VQQPNTPVGAAVARTVGAGFAAFFDFFFLPALDFFADLVVFAAFAFADFARFADVVFLADFAFDGFLIMSPSNVNNGK